MQNTINTGAKTIKKIMTDKHISVKSLAQKLQNNGYYIEPQVLSNKLYRDTFSLNEYTLIVDALECDVKTISRDGKIEYTIKSDTKRESSKFNSNKVKMKQVAEAKKSKSNKEEKQGII